MNEANPYPRIYEAIREDDWELVDSLLDKFPEMVAFDVPAFGTWLHVAAAHGTPDMVKHLIDRGFDLNSRDGRGGTTPLQYAADEGRVEIAALLLDRGAEMDVSTTVRNPLFGAIVGNSPDIAKLLLERGIDTKARYTGAGIRGMDAVAFAMMWGRHDIARMIALRDAGGDEKAAEAAMVEGDRIAEENTTPADPDVD